MDWGGIRDYLLPSAEKDEGFRQEMLRLSHRSLRLIGGVSLGVPVFMILARMVLAPDPTTLPFRLTQGGLIAGIGLAAFLLSREDRTYEHSRAIAVVSGILIGNVMIVSSLGVFPSGHDSVEYIPSQIALVMLVAVAAIPVRPVQVFATGGVFCLVYVVSCMWTRRQPASAEGLDRTYVVFIVMLTLLTTALTAVMYGERYKNYLSYVRALSASEDLCQAQTRILLSENAASLGRLAAALSHELNSPIGALVSGVDTLLLLAARQATSTQAEQQRLVLLQAELRQSVKESAERLRNIVARMQRFTNLDKAEIQQASVNDILSDVVSLADPAVRGGVEIELDLQTVPPLICRPQQLSAVFNNLLTNSLRALDGRGRVVISTRQKDSQIEVRVADSGSGVESAALEGIFDPNFKVQDGRVATGNWGLFSSRQTVREHGGDVRFLTSGGQGTTVVVTLPCSTSAQSLRIPT